MPRSTRPLAIVPALLAAGMFVAGFGSRVRADDAPQDQTLTLHDEHAEAAVRAALVRHVAIDVSELPLREFFAAIERDCGIPVVVHEQAIEDEKGSLDTPVTLKLSGVTLRSALRWVLGPLQLRAVVHGGVLNFTSAAEAVNLRTSRVYNVSDLVANPENPNAALEELLRAIEANTGGEPDGPWPDNAPEGSRIQPRTIHGKTLLVIEQTDAVHQEIQQLLRDIRAALLQKPSDTGSGRSTGVARSGDRSKQQASRAPDEPKAGAVIRFVSESGDSTPRIRRALEQRVSVDFGEVPLNDFVESIARTCGIPVIVNAQALLDERIKLDTPVSLTASRIDLRSMLDLALQPLKLRALLVDEVLLITTAAEAENEFSCRVYDVTDVTPRDDSRADGQESLDRLVQISTGDKRHARWQEQDGAGGSVSRLRIQQRELLVIRQTGPVFREIDRLLRELRAQVISITP
jgi:hypothetical protein